MSDDEKHYLDPPNNTDIPFFAYGIFKPGQLAFSRIEEAIERISYSKIKYNMRVRDGVPIIGKDEKNNSKTYGYLIFFKEECKQDAYRIIGETEPNKLYYWDEITVDNEQCNVLKGKKFKYGSNSPEFDINEFKGHKDPFFKEALDLIKESINAKEKLLDPENELFENEIKHFFNLQMHYMLLWSAIDRFTRLKYNKKFQSHNIIEFSGEQSFEKSFYKNFKENRVIFPNDYLKPISLYRERSDWKLSKSMYYYYKVRCNVVHRGKSIIGDEKDLRHSLIELSNIFKDVLNDTFNIVTIDGVDFCIPYGLKEVTGENDSTRVFKRDEDNQINGIPNYTIEISSDIKDFEDCYSIGENYFNIKIIDADDDKKRNIIRHLNNKLNKVHISDKIKMEEK